MEHQSELEGVDIMEDSVRVYNDSEYFAPLIGYTGKISSEELEELQEENPDYSTTSIVGKTGIEQVMETTLQERTAVRRSTWTVLARCWRSMKIPCRNRFREMTFI